MALVESLYATLVRLARSGAPLAARGTSKLARGVRGRRGAAARLVAWGVDHRHAHEPLVWVHAPSVGEGLQARAVLGALHSLRPGLQAVFTHFSPSAEGLAASMPADVADYLPWDLPDEMGPVLDALRPDLLVFTKTEVWPVLGRLARERGIATALVAATLAPSSSRQGWWARRLLGPAYALLDRVLVVGEDDARRLRTLGVRTDALEVTGDPGVDSAATRARGADPGAPWLAPLLEGAGPTLVAGSTWPADEGVLVPAVTRVRDTVPELRLVVAPHEPDERHVPPLLAALERTGWRCGTLGQVEAAGTLGDVRAVVVDRVGVLAHLYTAGTAAYVGGGFGRDGLHSVLEPAAAGIPMAFGPRNANARAAGDLLAAGAALQVADAGELAAALIGWFTEPGARASAGEAARGYIDSHLGAALRSAQALAALLPAPSAPTADEP